MSKDYLSIEISEYRINFVVGHSSLDGIHITKMFSIENSNTYLLDGNKIDSEILIKDIRNALKTNKVNVKDTIVTLSPKFVEVVEKTIEKIDESLIEEMIKIELISDGVILDDFEIQLMVDDIKDNINELYKVKIYLMSKELIESILDMLKKLGKKPCYLDLNNNGVDKLHNKVLELNANHPDYTLFEREDTTVMYVDFSSKSLLVSIMKGTNQELYRIQENQLYSVLYDDKKEDLLNIYDRFIDSLEITNRYYKGLGIGNYIDEVYFYGFNSKYEVMDPLAEELADRIGANVNTLSGVNGVINGIDDDTDISSYFNALNALIRL